MKRFRIFLVSLAWGAAFVLVGARGADVTIAQLSDTHLGEKHSLQAAANLRQAVKMINARHPDAVIVSGDIGENSAYREEAKTILTALIAPVYYVPGNHDVTNTVELAGYRKQFGPDYYHFQVKYVEVLAIDSELLGNYAIYKNWKTLPPLSPGMAVESRKMLAWLGGQAASTKGKVVIAVQHIPLYRDHGFPNSNAYWVIDAPYAKRETSLLQELGVKHLLAGHWHIGRVFTTDGITVHVAPATSWLPLGGELGFALHTVTQAGEVHTEFVPLPKSSP